MQQTIPGPAAAAAASGASRFELSLRVYYEDTDAGGVVYYANYLKFLERARTEWLRVLGVAQQDLLTRRQLAFVVRRVEADFLRSAQLDDVLHVVSEVERLGPASVLFGQRIERRNDTGTEVLLSARVSVACVDWARKRPTALPDDIRSRLQDIQQQKGHA